MRNLPRSYLAVVVLPWALIALYVLFLQSPRFESVSLLVVEQDQSLQAAVGLDLGMLGLGLGSDSTDSLVVLEFIESRRLFNELEERHGLVGHWTGPDVDFFSRLAMSAGNDERFAYYRDMVDAKVNADSGVISVSFQAYEPEFAEAVLGDIVESSERFINGISQDLARSQVRFVESELVLAHKRLTDQANNLLLMQQESDVLSPEAEAEASMKILGGLQARRAGLETELRTLLSYLNENAPDVVATRRQLHAVNQQIHELRGEQTGSGAQGMNRLLLDFKEAEMAAELAADMYKVGLQTLETTRLEASRKAKFLVQVDPPSLPDEPRYPDEPRLLAFTALGLNLLYFLAVLTWAAIREHSE